jgi:hypothetical protein
MNGDNIMTPDDNNPSSLTEKASLTTETCCQHCATMVTLNETYCHSCGFPVKGTEHQQKRFLIDKEIKQLDLNEDEGSVTSAEVTIFVLAGLTMLSGVFLSFMAKSYVVLVISLVLALIYIALGFWAKQKPLPAILCCLVLYVTLVALDALYDPASLLKGIILKIAIVAYLIKGVMACIEVEKQKKEQKSNE